MIFKVNFEKAYDYVRWYYLDDILDKFGFGNKWRRWIRGYLYSSTGSLLVNGSSDDFCFLEGYDKVTLFLPFFLF